MFSRSDTDHLPSFIRTETSKSATSERDSFYQTLLRHHEKNLCMDYTKTKDGDIQGKDEENNKGDVRCCERKCGRSGRRNNKSHQPFTSSSELATSTGSSMNRSSIHSRNKLPPSLYPTIIEDITENKSLGVAYDRQRHDLQQQCRSENLDKINSSKVEPDPTEALSSSQPVRDVNGMSTGSADSTNCATVLPRMSSFYQEALHAAQVIEDGQDELLLERLNQCGPISPEYSSSEAQDDEDFANIRTPVGTANSFDANDSVKAAYNPISPFYRAALENAGFAEEEELYLMQQHQQKRSEEEQRAGKIDERNAIDKTDSTTTSTPSSFYQSALKEAMMIQQEEGVDDEFKQDEEGPFLIPTVYDGTSSIHQRSGANGLHKPKFQSGYTIDETGTFDRRTGDKDGEKRSLTCSISSLPSSSCSNSPSAMEMQPVLARAKLVESNSSHLKRSHIDSSILSSAVLPVGVNSISSNQCSSSCIDDSCELSVTRSLIMPHLKNSVLPKNSVVNATKMVEKNMLNGLRGIQYSRNTTHDSQDDDEELRLAVDQSQFSLSSNSSLQPKGAFSYALSTGGTRSESEEKVEEERYSDQIFQSSSPTENNNEFLISQFKAMEECHKNNSRNDRDLVTFRPSSPDRLISAKNRFLCSRTTATSTPPSSGEARQTRGRSRLEIRGATETRKAISNGSSHVVKCKGCRGRLQAPVYYSLVFCPKCQTVSPA